MQSESNWSLNYGDAIVSNRNNAVGGGVPPNLLDSDRKQAKLKLKVGKSPVAGLNLNNDNNNMKEIVNDLASGDHAIDNNVPNDISSRIDNDSKSEA